MEYERIEGSQSYEFRYIVRYAFRAHVMGTIVESSDKNLDHESLLRLQLIITVFSTCRHEEYSDVIWD